MIDQSARDRLQQVQTAKAITDGIDRLSQAIRGGKGESGEMVLANEFKELQKVLNQEALQKLKSIIDGLDEKVKSLSEIEKNLPRKIEMNFPDTYPVSGSVAIENPVAIKNPEDIAKQLAPLLSNLQAATFKAMQQIKVAVPSAMSVKDEVQIKDFQDLLDGIEELKKGFNILINKEAATVSFPSNTIPVEIQNWMIPQPVTHVSINGLTGETLATQVTVTTTLTKLPSTALANRRSLVLYNNSASTTIFIGGSNVTAATGVPVPAGTYSPAFDASPNLVIYGVTSSGSADIRVLELSDEGSGR